MINKTEKKGEKKHIAAPKACFLFDLNFTSQSLQKKKKNPRRENHSLEQQAAAHRHDLR